MLEAIGSVGCPHLKKARGGTAQSPGGENMEELGLRGSVDPLIKGRPCLRASLWSGLGEGGWILLEKTIGEFLPYL